MANEVRHTVSLHIAKGKLRYQSPSPTLFISDMTGSKGPSPGAIAVTTFGTDVDLSQLTMPGMYSFTNLSETNRVEYGIWDPDTSRFYPWGELLPGETHIGRFSRNLQEEYIGTGTGTSAPTNRVRFKAIGASCNVKVEAFEA